MAKALKPRLARSGLSNVHPAQIAHERDDRVKRLAGKIDRVLVDAPCSGLGTLRRNPDLKWRQSPQAVLEMQAKQTAILDSAQRLLKSGGRLVYATCTLTRSENRDLIGAFVRNTPDAISVPAENWEGWPNFGEADDYGRQILPGEAGADGFYYAVVNKQ